MGVKNGFTACNPDLLTPLWIPAFAGMTELFKGLLGESGNLGAFFGSCARVPSMRETPLIEIDNCERHLSSTTASVT